MSVQASAVEQLDRDFLEIRHGLLGIAAALDRIDRAEGNAEAHGDPRWGQLQEAVRLLTDGQSDRASRAQMVFSDSYESNWRAGS